jgi:hypothetical protein
MDREMPDRVRGLRQTAAWLSPHSDATTGLVSRPFETARQATGEPDFTPRRRLAGRSADFGMGFRKCRVVREVVPYPVGINIQVCCP